LSQSTAGAPIRASATDAQFYVQWIDNLLQKTAVGGDWSSFFTKSRSQVHARYQAAKAIYQRRADEASSPPNPGGSQTIFTNQRPTLFEQDASYELGTLFWSNVPGSIAGVRIYSHAAEGGVDTVRIWNANGSIVAGPYQWNINAGNEGWKTFDLPAPVAINANTNYIVSVSNSSSDRYYAEQPHAFDAPIVSGNLHTRSGSGVWTNIIGTMPVFVWENTSYFRDVNFVPE
jgi:hypothetical protein